MIRRVGLERKPYSLHLHLLRLDEREPREDSLVLGKCLVKEDHERLLAFLHKRLSNAYLTSLPYSSLIKWNVDIVLYLKEILHR